MSDFPETTVRFYDHTTAFDAVKNDPFLRIDEMADDGQIHQRGGITIGQAMKPSQFYLWALENLRTQVAGRDPNADEITSELTLQADWQWLEAGEPYYRIMPDMLPSLLRTELAVPSSLLRLPHPAILIRLPLDHKDGRLTDPHGRELRTIMACQIDDDYVAFLMDTGADRGRGPEVFWHTQRLTGGRTINELAATGRDVTSNCSAQRPLTLHCLRVAAAVVFMATRADTLVEVDVLNRDVDRYYDPKTSDEDREKMRRRALRLPGHNGYVVGVDRRRRDIRLPRNGVNGTHRANGKGRSLCYQHRRSGHWRFYLKPDCSVGHTWVRSAVVRPDLPPHPHRRGYAVGE